LTPELFPLLPDDFLTPEDLDEPLEPERTEEPLLFVPEELERVEVPLLELFVDPRVFAFEELTLLVEFPDLVFVTLEDLLLLPLELFTDLLDLDERGLYAILEDVLGLVVLLYAVLLDLATLLPERL